MIDQFIKLIYEHPQTINAISALCALFVSVLAISLTAYTAWRQRQHNFMSLRPMASIVLGDYENKLEVKLKNVGIGPLLINNLIVSGAETEMNTVISGMPRLPIGITWSTFTENVNGWCLAKDADICLIRLEGDPDDDAFAFARDEIRKSLSKLTVRVEYKDIYDRIMPPVRRTLEFFGRHF
jgi:hypothetical protein